MFGPPGSLTEVSLVETCGEAPAAWGVFPRTVLQLLKVPGLGKLHASAVEVYQDKAYDLLANRAALTVGTQKAGHKVSGGVALLGAGTQKPMREPTHTTAGADRVSSSPRKSWLPVLLPSASVAQPPLLPPLPLRLLPCPHPKPSCLHPPVALR